MTTHMHREISDLKEQLLELSSEVEKSIRSSGRALEVYDDNLACQVITNDNRINDIEVNIEEDCLKILALYQPVAHDLRTVVAILKINNDLERMADLAVNISKYLLKIKEYGEVSVSECFKPMFETCLTMVRDCIDAFMKEDITLAAKVCEMDNIVDDYNVRIITEIQEEMKKENPSGPINSILFMLSVCRTVERIADYATNIAEDVYYMVSGKIIRHHADMFVN